MTSKLGRADLSFSIRPFQKTDRQSVFQIAADTAYFGKPVEFFLDDRRLFVDAFYRYYTDFESEHGWVSCVEDRVVGFLMGCNHTNRQRHILITRCLPRVVLQIIRDHYRVGVRTRRYLWAFTFTLFLPEFPPVDLQQFPAHMHLNIAEEWRGNGLGRQLWNAYLEQLYEEEIPGVHLHTTDHHKVACDFYASLGFKLVAKRASIIWANLFGIEVINLCYAKSLETRT